MKSLRFTCFFIKQTKEVEQVEKFVRSLSITILAKYEDEIYKLYPRRLERYLSIAWDSGAVPVIVLTKVDLCDDLEEKRLEIENVAVGVPVVETSGLTGDGLQQIEQYLQGTKTVAFIGSSGVGKSTLINKSMSEECLKTNTLRKDDKGRHTTTHRELFLLPDTGMVIDTPGMREFGMWNAGEGIEHTFSDIEKLAENLNYEVLKSVEQVNEGILDGRYSVGVTTEAAAQTLRSGGADVDYIYPEEGTAAVLDGTAVRAGSSHKEEALAFLDFTVSRDAQKIMAVSRNRRSVRTDTAAEKGMDPMEKLPLSEAGWAELSEAKQQADMLWQQADGREGGA